MSEASPGWWRPDGVDLVLRQSAFTLNYEADPVDIALGAIVPVRRNDTNAIYYPLALNGAQMAAWLWGAKSWEITASVSYAMPDDGPELDFSASAGTYIYAGGEFPPTFAAPTTWNHALLDVALSQSDYAFWVTDTQADAIKRHRGDYQRLYANSDGDFEDPGPFRIKRFKAGPEYYLGGIFIDDYLPVTITIDPMSGRDVSVNALEESKWHPMPPARDAAGLWYPWLGQVLVGLNGGSSGGNREPWWACPINQSPNAFFRAAGVPLQTHTNALTLKFDGSTDASCNLYSFGDPDGWTGYPEGVTVSVTLDCITV